MASDSSIPFIDRDEALEKLREFTKSRGGQCLLVVGRSGIGKTRLFRRFASIEDHGDGVERICVMHDVRQRTASLDEFSRLERALEDHPAIQRLVRRPGLPAWVPDLIGWLRRIAIAASPEASALLEHLPVEKLVRRVVRTDRLLNAGDIAEQLLKTLRALGRLLRPEQRLVLLFDPTGDFDDASEELRKFLTLLDVVRELPERVVVVVALRSSDPAVGSFEVFPPNLDLYRDLQPFGVADVLDLLRKVFDREVPYAVAEAIQRRFGGDPLHLELAVECARDATDPLLALEKALPAKLSALMDLYYDKLETPLQKKVLRILAVALVPVGVSFVLQLLDGTVDPDEVRETLTGRRAPRIIEKASSSSGESTFTIYLLDLAHFLRSLSREYGELQELDRRAGAYFHDQGDHSLALYHFACAGDLGGIGKTLEAGLDWHRILGETRRVGELYGLLAEVAMPRHDRFLLDKAYAWSRTQAGVMEDVVQLVGALLEDLLEDSEERAELLILRGDAFHNGSRYREAYQDFTAAREILARLGREESLLYRQASLEAAHIEIHLGWFRTADQNHYALYRTQGSDAQASDPRILFQWAREMRRYGELLVFTGELDDAERYLRVALEALRDLGDRKEQGNALRRLADINILRKTESSLRQAVRDAQRGKDLLSDLGSRGAGWMDLVLGEAYRGLGDLEEATRAHSSASERYGQGDSPHLASMSELALAECERQRTGQPALERYDSALSRYEAIEFDWGIATALLYRGLAHTAAGDRESAGADLERSLSLFERLELRPPRQTIRSILEKEDLGFHPIIVL